MGINVKKVVGGGLLAGGMGIAALGLGAGTATANPIYTWCPGDSTDYHASPNGHEAPIGLALGHYPTWNMNVCHDWKVVVPGQGNLPFSSGERSWIWDSAMGGDAPVVPMCDAGICTNG
ncbi:hypothetical protein FZI93_11310 [Mycobacterium sp. CBMA361]|nr:hypothetical protein [Mycolicibacterium sp. CBMA 361]